MSEVEAFSKIRGKFTAVQENEKFTLNKDKSQFLGGRLWYYFCKMAYIWIIAYKSHIGLNTLKKNENPASKSLDMQNKSLTKLIRAISETHP